MLRLIGRLLCSDHPKYEGKGVPTSKCIACLVVYVDRHAGGQMEPDRIARLASWIERMYGVEKRKGNQ